VFVNNQHGIERRGQGFDKKFVFEGVHSREWGYDYEPASKQKDVISSTRCNQSALFRATHILSQKVLCLRMLKYFKYSVNT